ncbi:unnamed protein product [Diatraea saccharalis]|uniref:Uncharacterized protein n=1 Tax=Diatraea saccharalis TaxID=40085 RepID=A0A9P0G312_9NEOP|nr:unnamed protein product [Diatraea saccharalis]
MMDSKTQFIIILALVIRNFQCKITVHSDDKDNHKLLLQCITKITKSNFIYAPTISINENNEINNLTIHEYTHDFIDQLIHMTSKYNMPTIINSDEIIESMYVPEKHLLSIQYILNCDTLLNEEFRNINETIKYLVIIFNTSEACDSILFNNVSRHISKYEMTFLKLTYDNNYDILTFIPKLNSTDCKMQFNISYTSIADCASEGDLIIFPNKETQNDDMMGCPFRVGMTTYIPFSKIKDMDTMQLMDPIKYNDIRGCDVELMKIMSEYFNFTIQYYFIFDNEAKSEISTEFLKFLLNGTLDACAGGLFRIYGDIVDYSGVYGRQAFIWMYTVKRSARSWKSFVGNMNGLYIFIVFYFCFSFIWYLLHAFDKQAIPISNIMLYGWGALIGTSSLYKAQNLKHRITNIFYLIMCLHLVAYVNIQMYSFLTITSPPTIYKTNEEMYKSNLIPYLDPKSKYFVHDKQYETFANTSVDCDFFTDCENKIMGHNGVTLTVDGRFMLFQAKTIVDDEVGVLKVSENMLTVYHEILFRKNVTITKKFQKIMTRLGEAGIMERLYHEVLPAAPIDIVTEKIQGKFVLRRPPIHLMIPDQEPLFRRQKDTTPIPNELYLKFHASQYIQDYDRPFITPVKPKYKVPSLNHGIQLFNRQNIPLMKKIIMGDGPRRPHPYPLGLDERPADLLPVYDWYWYYSYVTYSRTKHPLLAIPTKKSFYV